MTTIITMAASSGTLMPPSVEGALVGRDLTDSDAACTAASAVVEDAGVGAGGAGDAAGLRFVTMAGEGERLEGPAGRREGGAGEAEALGLRATVSSRVRSALACAAHSIPLERAALSQRFPSSTKR